MVLLFIHVCISIFHHVGALSPFSTNFFTVLKPGRHGLPILCKNTLALIYKTTAGSERTFLKGCAVSYWTFLWEAFNIVESIKWMKSLSLKGQCHTICKYVQFSSLFLPVYQSQPHQWVNIRSHWLRRRQRNHWHRWVNIRSQWRRRRERSHWHRWVNIRLQWWRRRQRSLWRRWVD